MGLRKTCLQRSALAAQSGKCPAVITATLLRAGANKQTTAGWRKDAAMDNVHLEQHQASMSTAARAWLLPTTQGGQSPGGDAAAAEQ